MESRLKKTASATSSPRKAKKFGQVRTLSRTKKWKKPFDVSDADSVDSRLSVDSSSAMNKTACVTLKDIILINSMSPLKIQDILARLGILKTTELADNYQLRSMIKNEVFAKKGIAVRRYVHQLVPELSKVCEPDVASNQASPYKSQMIEIFGAETLSRSLLNIVMSRLGLLQHVKKPHTAKALKSALEELFLEKKQAFFYDTIIGPVEIDRSGTAPTRSRLNRVRNIKYAFLVVLTWILFSTYIYRKVVSPFKYQSSGQETQILESYSPIQVFSYLRDYRLLCPSNAICNNGSLTCAPNYIYCPNLILFGGTCIPNHQLIKMVSNIKRDIQVFLSLRAGRAGYIENESFRHVPIQEISSTLSSYKIYLNSSDFPMCFDMAMKEAINENSIRLSPVKDGDTAYYYSDNPTISLEIYIKSHLKRLLRFLAPILYGTVIAMVTALLAVSFVRHYFRTKKNTNNIYHQVIAQLERAKQDGVPEVALMTRHLNGLKEKERASIWKQVRNRIHRNPLVREYPKKVNGEAMNHWKILLNIANHNSQ